MTAHMKTTNSITSPITIFEDSASHLAPADWLVENLITSESLASIIGASGSGKSFIALDLALSIAAGHPYHGHPVKQGSVLYMAGEGITGLQKRAAAWCLTNNQKTNGNFLIHEGGMDLANPDCLEAYAEALATQLTITPSLIVIDTLARYALSAEENSNTEMSLFVENLAAQFQRRLGAAVLIVHHTGKHSSSARGASSLNAAVDHEFKVRKLPADPTFDGLCAALENTKAKETEEAPTMTFELDKQDLTLSCGHVETSLVPRLRSSSNGSTATELCLSGAVQVLYDTIEHYPTIPTRLQVREVYQDRGLNTTNLSKQVKALTLELYRVNPDANVDKNADPWAVLTSLMAQQPKTQTQQISDI